MVTHTCSSITWETEAGNCSEFGASELSQACLKTTDKKIKTLKPSKQTGIILQARGVAQWLEHLPVSVRPWVLSLPQHVQSNTRVEK